MLEFIKIEKNLVLVYRPISSWVQDVLAKDGEVKLRKGTYVFEQTDILRSEVINDEEIYEFALGHLSDGYYQVHGRVLGIEHSIFLHESLEPDERWFTTVHGFSVFKRASKIVKENIYIGGPDRRSIPEEEFKQLLKDFPSYYEIGKYVDARLGAVLHNYFETAAGVGESYQRYMNKRRSVTGVDLRKIFREAELEKYSLLLKKVKDMLEHENLYNERQWQEEILQVVLLLFPKYIYAFKGVQIYDSYSEKKRELDIMLVDANGHIDVIEIKKPFDEKILTNGVYRDNHIPMRELTGTVMQIEKYIFYLNKWGIKGEEDLTKKYISKISTGFNLKVTNPCGIVIMGRDNTLSPTQIADFEVVKRKYKNIVDIITYDDLIRRLEAVITSLKAS